MKCPVCGGNTRVMETRENQWGNERKRECLECGIRFITLERVTRVCKKNGGRMFSKLKPFLFC